MKISVAWLRELFPTQLSDDDLAARLTAVGLEVEGRERRALGERADVVSARVQTRTPVEGSDHLSVCQVDDGSTTRQVVCGAQNYAAGDVVALARPGAVLPGGLEIKQAKLRGVQSDGMLCSARELGLSDDHSGLLVLPAGTPLGAPLSKLLGLPDTVLELNVTPNRPDALSHLGVARELGALLGQRVAAPVAQPAGEQVVDAAARVEVQDAQRCPRFAARVIEGVRIGPSPLEVQERLRACGVRPISNVVDATNLVLLELGHPMHAYDLDRLAGARLVVRRAGQGERLTTLDGKERELVEDDLVIADGDKAVGLAGVMGGQHSEVSQGTTRLLLESAMFEPAGIRRTARRHALHTEASHRFERGADEVMARIAIDRCAALIVELAGGRVLPGVIDRYPSPRPAVSVRVRPERVAAVLGAPVDAAEVEARLASLGLAPSEPERDGARTWKVPHWRRDLVREIDCVEEIARQRGLDTIPIVVSKAGVGETAASSPERAATQAARAALAARGIDEVLNYSFVAERDLQAVFQDAKTPAMRVANPLTVEQGAMRTSLVAGLLRNLGHNLARGAQDVRLYELGRVYLPERDPRHAEGPLAWPDHEPRRLGLLLLGRRAPRSWTAKDEPVDFFDLKGALDDVLSGLSLEATWAPGAASFLHPSSAAALSIGGVAVGVAGELHPRVAKAFDVPARTLVAELDWEALVAHAQPVRKLHGVPRFPSIARDLAFVVDAALPSMRMLGEIRAADVKGLIEQVVLFDVYRGAPVAEGKKSVAYALSLRAADRTLTDAEADALVLAVKERLRSALGAEVRA